jgi:hypothetical protein
LDLLGGVHAVSSFAAVFAMQDQDARLHDAQTLDDVRVAFFRRTGGCSWGDVLTLSVDGEVVSPQDLQVCVIDASGSGEFGAGKGVVGVLRVPLLSIEHHVCDSAPSEDPDKVSHPSSLPPESGQTPHQHHPREAPRTRCRANSLVGHDCESVVMAVTECTTSHEGE